MAFSVWKFRLWRSLAVVFHAAFLRHFFLAVNLGSSVLLLTVTTAAITALALRLYSMAARFLTSIENQLGLQFLILLVVSLAYETMILGLRDHPHGAALIAFQIMSFVAYLRSVVSADRTKMISVLFALSLETASLFNRKGIDGVVHFAAAGFLASLAMVTDRGYRAPEAGAFDHFLDILGDLDQ